MPRGSQITNINALSCFGKLTSLLELTLDLSYCEGLLDIDPLSSLERCVNLKKLDLDLRCKKVTSINALSCFGELASLLELALNLVGCSGVLDIDPLSSIGRCVNLQKLSLSLGCMKVTDINPLSCLGKLGSLLELQINLRDCGQLADISALSSLEALTGLQKLRLLLHCTEVSDNDCQTLRDRLRLSPAANVLITNDCTV